MSWEASHWWCWIGISAEQFGGRGETPWHRKFKLFPNFLVVLVFDSHQPQGCFYGNFLK